MTRVRAYASKGAGAPLEPFEYDLPELGPNDVDVRVTHCGICHSDLSMLHNAWGMTAFPFVPGHEAAGVVEAIGALVRGLKVGDRVGVGWHAGSCMHCSQCMGGNHNLCAEQVGTIVGRHGGFADRVRCQSQFAVGIPDAIELRDAGPMFCGGITVFDPIRRFVRPTDRVGVIGIGGLGHLALGFARAWGCHVTAFTSTDAKADEARAMGAHEVINSRDERALSRASGSMDFVISTVNVAMDWGAYVGVLRAGGRLHMAGALLEPMAVSAMGLIMGQKEISGSPVGSPGTIGLMLEFAARHGIRPVVEEFALSEVNAALAHLEAGRARYRIVLRA